jgi:hypothetical protein
MKKKEYIKACKELKVPSVYDSIPHSSVEPKKPNCPEKKNISKKH